MTALRYLLSGLLLTGPAVLAGSPAEVVAIKLSAATLSINTLRDDYGILDRGELALRQLPEIELRYARQGGEWLPMRTTRIVGLHPYWEFLALPAREMPGPSGLYLLAPVALLERNANCTHYAVLNIALNDPGTPSTAQLQIASETCQYLKFNAVGEMTARRHSAAAEGMERVLAARAAELARRLPGADFSELAARYPDLDTAAFGAGIAAEDMTVYGFVAGGVHYRSDCRTRSGRYAGCDDIPLPSYSVAKSVFAALALMRLEKLYPGSRDALIADYVPACRAAQGWTDVRFEDALNMTTGHYASADDHADEWSAQMEQGFFIPEDHLAKIDFACSAYPRRAAPGKTFAYHTSDTYLLTTAMQQLYRDRLGTAADIFDDLVQPIYRAAGLSAIAMEARRSYDDTAQAWGGFGLNFKPDDVARLALFLMSDTAYRWLDQDMLDHALQRVPDENGVDAGRFNYQFGYWSLDLTSQLHCVRQLSIPFMSGYGGINVVLLPEDMVYYYFSDGGQFAWLQTAIALQRISLLCPDNNRFNHD